MRSNPKSIIDLLTLTTEKLDAVSMQLRICDGYIKLSSSAGLLKALESIDLSLKSLKKEIKDLSMLIKV